MFYSKGNNFTDDILNILKSREIILQMTILKPHLQEPDALIKDLSGFIVAMKAEDRLQNKTNSYASAIPTCQIY